MKKIITLVCFVLCIMVLCTSCTKSMSFKELYAEDKYEDSYPTFTTITELIMLEGHEAGSYYNEILVVYDDEKIKFYNTAKDSYIITLSDEYLDSYDFFTVSENTFIITCEKDKNDETVYSTKIYDANGSNLLTKKGYHDIDDYSDLVTISGDLFQFDNGIYRVADNGNVYPVLSNPFYGELQSFDAKTESYYYDISSSSFSVYDHSLNSVFYWEIPYTSYDKCQINLLSDTIVLVQIIDVLPDTETKYDYIDNSGKKCKLTSIIVNVKDGKEKTVKLNYLVADTLYMGNLIGDIKDSVSLPEEIDNVAYIAYIKDHKLLSSDSALEVVSLNAKDGGIAYEIAKELDSIPTRIAENRFLYTTASGEKYLIDENGTKIAKISSVFYSAETNEKYIVMNDKIYNYNLEEVYDCDSNKQEVVKLLGHSIILRDDKFPNPDYYLFTEEGAVIDIEDYAYSYSQFYVTYDYDDSRYTFYNEKGTYIASFKDVVDFDIVHEDEDNNSVIIAIEYKDNVKYHKLSK